MVDPHEAPHGGGVGRIEVVGPVVEAEQVSRRGLVASGGACPGESTLDGSHGGRSEGQSGELVDGMEGHLGVVGTSLDTDVAAGQSGIEGVTGKGGQVDEGGGPVGAQAEPAVEQSGTEAHRDGQARGG